MNERLLQFIWQFRYFNRQGLQTTQGEPLQIIKTGLLNQHQGPDFSEAIIRIGNTTWVGNIEIHILSSDWHRHRHATDPHYATVILHVVWQEDLPIYDLSGHLIPSLILQPLVSQHLLQRYEQIMNTTNDLPCSRFLPALETIAWMSWKERLAAERLERRSAYVWMQIEQNNGNWEEAFWWLLSANFGIQVNTPLFRAVAQSLPLTLLSKHRNRPAQVEALLFGQANLLEGQYTDAYALLLKKEYRFLSRKYLLTPVNAHPAFLRMRPAAFPTVRMAQLAALITSTGHLFSTLRETKEVKTALGLFKVQAGDYWDTHYRFDEPAVHMPKQVGMSMAENILINTAIPVLFAYGAHTRDETLKNRAIQWLYQLPAEHNRITRSWTQWQVANHSALDSQALIELTNHYCTQKRCLDCSVGNRILKN